MFVDLDRESGEVVESDYESIRAALADGYRVSEMVPDRVRDRIDRAMDFIALAYEQANLGRMQFFGTLTDAGLSSAMLGLELALKEQMPVDGKDKRTLGTLIDAAKAASILPAEPYIDSFLGELLNTRNALAHGMQDAPLYGVASGCLAGMTCLSRAREAQALLEQADTVSDYRKRAAQSSSCLQNALGRITCKPISRARCGALRGSLRSIVRNASHSSSTASRMRSRSLALRYPKAGVSSRRASVMPLPLIASPSTNPLILASQ